MNKYTIVVVVSLVAAAVGILIGIFMGCFVGSFGSPIEILINGPNFTRLAIICLTTALTLLSSYFALAIVSAEQYNWVAYFFCLVAACVGTFRGLEWMAGWHPLITRWLIS